MKVLSQYQIEGAENFEVSYFKEGEIKNYIDINVDAIVCSRSTAREILNYNFPNLKLVQLNSAGFEQIDLNKYRENGVDVCNAGATYSVCMAETIIFGILQIEKRLRKNPNNRKFKIFRHYNEIGELKGKMAVTLGAGNIATQVVKRLNSFDVECYGYDPFCVEKTEFRKLLRSREELNEILPKADYVINTLPLLKDTEHFIDSDLLHHFKSSAVFINVGRIGSINTSDLYLALKRREISYAVLDMFEKFPNPLTNKFRRLKNVIVLPGVAAISKESKLNLKKLIGENLKKLSVGERPLNIIN